MRPTASTRAGVVAGDADQQLVEAVAVQVPRTRDRVTEPVVGPAHASTAGCVMKLVCSGNLGIDIENVIEQLCAIYDVDGATSSS